MRYYLLQSLKCLVVGVAAALGAFVVAILVVLLLDAVVLSIPIGERLRAIAETGIGNMAAPLEPALAAMVGFVAGFWFVLGKRDGSSYRHA
jgi:hypothetical protein